MKNVLISGVSGFVGKNLSVYLQQKGFGIIPLSRTAANAGEKQLSWGKINEVHQAHLDAYIHLAGKAHDVKNTSSADAYFETNTELTKKLFNEFLKSAASVFIYFSSVKAAADTVKGELDEDATPSPKTPYGQSKLKAEEYILSQSLPEHRRVYILRPCMIHGPGNKGNLNLLYKFVQKGIPYPLASFSNMRSFLYIENLNFIIERLLAGNAPSGIYNMADDTTLSTVEVVNIIAGVSGKKARLYYFPQQIIKAMARVGDLLHLPLNSEKLKKLTENYMVSNKKIKNALGVQQLPYAVNDGLASTIKSFNAN